VVIRTIVNGLFAATGTLALAACSPSGKAADPAPSTDTAAATATPPAATAAAPAASAPASLFDGIAGADRVPASLLPQMAADIVPHWTRCGNEMVTQVMGADGKPQGFIVARGVSFTTVDAPIDVPSQQAGVTARRGINLRSNSHIQYFGEGVSRTDISGRTVTKAGWGAEQRLTAPLPFWRAEEAKGAWTAVFRGNAPDAAEWTARYRTTDCAALPPLT
jgi:hypothetical protein